MLLTANRTSLRCGTYLSPQLLPTYTTIVRALGEALGATWTLTETASLDDLAAGRFDLAFLCGAQYLRLAAQEPCPVTLLGAPVLRGRRYAGRPWYYSDVVVWADSPFQAWEDLAGTRFGINEPGSHSGYAVVQEQLRATGHDWGYFAAVRATGAHLRSLEAVCAGEIDAAAIDSQIWDVFRQRHRTLGRQLRSIAMLGPSTVPPIVIHRDVPATQVDRLRAALLALHTDPALARQLQRGGIRRFVAVTGADYDTMRTLWRDNHLLPATSTPVTRTEEPTPPPTLSGLGASSKIARIKRGSAAPRGDISAQLSDPARATPAR